MSMRNYGVYIVGAIFFDRDFDPVKVIKVVAKNNEVAFTDEAQSALDNGVFSDEVAAEICEKLDVPYTSENGTTKSYSDISDKLLSDKGDWFEGDEPYMGNDEVGVELFTEIEGAFLYSFVPENSDEVAECNMLWFPSPLPWELENYTGPKTKEQAIQLIQQTSQAMLKEDIDWGSRLGVLIGSIYG